MSSSRKLDSVYDPTYTVSMKGNKNSKGPPAPNSSLVSAISGGNRAKYFKQPIVPHLDSVPPEVLLAPIVDKRVEENRLNSKSKQIEDADDGTHRTISIQTIYRDSETQTQPYTPDYTLKSGENKPEILSLTSLKINNGLPIGLREMELIERNREKQQFDASLPPMTDEASFELRKKMMEEQEMRDMKWREDEIDEVQNQRLELLKHALNERDQEIEFLSEQRVEAIRYDREKEKDEKISKIQYQRVKSLRKMAKQRMKNRLNAKPRSIIEQYTDNASSKYAPITRDGTVKNFQVQLPSESISTSALEQVHNSLQTQSKSPFKSSISSKKKRKNVMAIEHLDRMTAILQKNKEDASSSKSSGKTSRKKTQSTKITRPTTPVLRADSLSEEKQRALILLQKLLRGRAIQNSMYEGKERRRELIKELRESEHHLSSSIEDTTLSEIDEACRDMVQGEVVSELLDFLHKAMIRSNEYKRIKKFINKGQEERNRREIEEGGRRQAENILRQRNEVVYESIQTLHEETSDDWLEDLMQLTIEDEAANEALGEIEVRREAMGPILDTMEQKQNSTQQNELIVQDLISALVYPEIMKLQNKQNEEKNKNRFLKAATDALLSSLTSF